MVDEDFAQDQYERMKKDTLSIRYKDIIGFFYENS